MNEKQKEKNMIDNTETNNTDTLGKRIMALRKAAGMTQEQVAERLGVSPQAVSKWENDVSCPDVTMIPRIAQLFNVSTDELLGLKASTVRPADTSSYSHGNGDCCKSSSATQGIGFGLLLIVLGIAYLVSRSTNASFKIYGAYCGPQCSSASAFPPPLSTVPFFSLASRAWAFTISSSIWEIRCPLK